MTSDYGILIRIAASHPLRDASGRETGKYVVVGPLAPGETEKVQAESYQFDLLDDLVGLGVAEVETAWIRFDSITFTDGTEWHGGMLFRPDPANPGSMIPIPKQ